MDVTEVRIAADRLLIVDTDKMLCELLQYKLENEGFKVDLIHNGEDALRLPLSDYSLILVDLMDSVPNGLKFIQLLRLNSDTASIPVIIMSAKATEDDIVAGLDSGADDYISKPLVARIVLARVRSVLRRRRVVAKRRMSNILIHQDLKLDLGMGTVMLNDEPLSLTRTEFLILAMFLRHKNQFFDRSEIQHEVWEDESNVSVRAVDTNISRLRKKIGSYGKNIVNRQGFGYGFID